mgnify:CR=1 FL=1|jgi:hypothetical protein
MQITPASVSNSEKYKKWSCKMSVGNVILNTYNKLKRRNKMTVANTYKVGDLYTSQKSKVTGTILEISPTAKDTVRVKLDVNGNTRWTTWKAQS